MDFKFHPSQVAPSPPARQRLQSCFHKSVRLTRCLWWAECWFRRPILLSLPGPQVSTKLTVDVTHGAENVLRFFQSIQSNHLPGILLVQENWFRWPFWSWDWFYNIFVCKSAHAMHWLWGNLCVNRKIKLRTKSWDKNPVPSLAYLHASKPFAYYQLRQCKLRC